MHRNSFIFLPGIAEQRERAIWERGIHDWETFLSTRDLPGFSWLCKEKHNLFLDRARQADRTDDATWFACNWPSNETWRLYDRFKEDALYLDIETGMYGQITVIGMMLRGTCYELVAGTNLDRSLLALIVREAKMLVTFNGSSFDWPRISKSFGLTLAVPHIDLRGVCSRVGLHGGLKAIEKELGIIRDPSVEGFSGSDAIESFHDYAENGNEDALDRLLLYNRLDTVNLKTLSEKAIPLLWKQTRFQSPNASVNSVNFR